MLRRFKWFIKTLFGPKWTLRDKITYIHQCTAIVDIMKCLKDPSTTIHSQFPWAVNALEYWDVEYDSMYEMSKLFKFKKLRYHRIKVTYKELPDKPLFIYLNCFLPIEHLGLFDAVALSKLSNKIRDINWYGANRYINKLEHLDTAFEVIFKIYTQEYQKDVVDRIMSELGDDFDYETFIHYIELRSLAESI